MEAKPLRAGSGRGMIRAVCISLAGLLVLSACGPDDDALFFDGFQYNTRVKSERKTREDFIVTARPVSNSLLGAREAARHQAISYCIEQYGSSAIDWVVGPDSPDEELPIDGDTLTLQGTCPQ